MFELRDGRECLWQWDADVQVIVSDPTITEVHFCNKTDDCSLVCEVYEDGGLRVANIPNILLQTDWDIRVYAYCNNYTKQEKIFKVCRRTKPSDYVYTETEVETWDKLEARMDAVEQLITEENIAQVVIDYLEENPIEISDEYITEDELDAKGYLTEVPKEYVTETELEDKGYLTEHQSLDGYATEEYVQNAVDRAEVKVFYLNIWNYAANDKESEANQDVIDCVEYLNTSNNAVVYLNTNVNQKDCVIATVQYDPTLEYYHFVTQSSVAEAIKKGHSVIDYELVVRYFNSAWRVTKRVHSVEVATIDYINDTLGVIENGSY